METNVGSTDRLVRLVVGAVLALAGIAGFVELWDVASWLAAIVLIVGVVLLGTGYTRQCLLYQPFGINTNR